MERLIAIIFAGMLIISLWTGCAFAGHSSDNDPLTVKDIIEMNAAKVGDEVIISQIEATGSVFHLSTQEIIALKDAGISDKVVKAIIETRIKSPSYQRRTGFTISPKRRYRYSTPYYYRTLHREVYYYPSHVPTVSYYPSHFPTLIIVHRSIHGKDHQIHQRHFNHGSHTVHGWKRKAGL